MRTSEKKINTSLMGQIHKTLAQALSDIKSEEEAKDFLKDFFTDSEVETFAKRLAVAYWLKKGRSYANIKQNLKVSSATIAEISSIMDKQGVRMVLSKIEADEWANVWTERIKKFIKR